MNRATPRMNAAWKRRGTATYEEGCDLERENQTMRAALADAVTYFVGTGRTSATVSGEAGKAADRIHAALAEASK